jgi:hypothetical protein
MAKKLTLDHVRRAVIMLAGEAKDRSVNHAEWVDNVSELVDRWWQNEMGTGDISETARYPRTEKDADLLRNITVIFDAVLRNGWSVETDSGLWDGLHPYQALVAQAYFTLRAAVLDEEPGELN